MSALTSGERVLGGEAQHYLAHVQRLRAGDEFVAFDVEACVECDATVLELSRTGVRCAMGEPRAARRSMLGAHLLQCLGKGDKAEDVVRAATALGVTSVTLCESERAVLKLGERAGSRRERWQGIALSAAQQCGRGDLPPIAGPLPLAEALSRYAPSDALKVCLHPRADISYGALLAALHDREVVLLIGPEGGLSDEELRLAEHAGFVLASFGPFELRTELAGVAALSALLARRGAAL